ncbi:MAG: type 4a pilus biogenesis protein PilO [Patescibacteria group bacterium]|nr:type 4a pilus biogenesis protein PilO [Patescibacteria group bacterium]
MEINLTPKKGINLNPASYRSEHKAQSLNFSLTEVVLLLIMIGLFYWYMVMPKQASLKAAQAQITQLTTDKSNIQGQIDSLNSSIKTLSSSKSSIADMDEALPLDSRTTKLQLLVESLASQAGVSLESVSFDSDSKTVYASSKEAAANPFSQPRKLKVIGGSVAVLGSFDQVQAFLGKVEKSARVLNIQTMNLNVQDAGVMSLRLDLEAYSYE